MGRLLAPGLALLLGVFASCATVEVDPRAPKSAEDEKAELYWTNLVASYRGVSSAAGDDEVIQAGITMGSDVCDRQLLDSSKVCSRPAATGDKHEIRCKMQCRTSVAKGGPTLAQATLFIAGRSVALQLDRLP